MVVCVVHQVVETTEPFTSLLANEPDGQPLNRIALCCAHCLPASFTEQHPAFGGIPIHPVYVVHPCKRQIGTDGRRGGQMDRFLKVGGEHQI